MDAWKIILIVICLFNAVLCYACCVVARRADDRAKKMYEKFEQEVTTKDEKVLNEREILIASPISDFENRQYSGLWAEED